MTVQDLMTEKVVSVSPATSVLDAAALLIQHSFNALPVLDEKGFLVGLFSERNLVLESSYMHLRTLLNLFNKIDFYKKENQPIKENLKKILNLKVSDVMDPKPTSIIQNATIEQVTNLFADPKNNPLPVVDADNRLVGIIAMADLLKLYGVNIRTRIKIQDIDQQVDQFIGDFEKQFVLVSKFRTRTWLMTSIIFAIIGFLIAIFWIIRIST